MASTPQTLVGTPGATTPAVDSHAHHGHHPHLHLHQAGKKIRHIFHPDGRKIHIANSPEEIDHLRKTVSATEKDGEFDVVIHGSPEHIEALRHTHAHHADRHQQLKNEHGPIADEFERVIREIDALSTELHMISEHAVQLDASFSKYGYSAHLRTKDDDSSVGDGASSFDKHQWAAERKLGETMRFYQKPIVRQYFHKGLLWRAKEAHEVASYELFIDLFYVGIIAITGDHAAEHPDGEQLLNFVITFVMGWKFWSDISTMIGWIDSDDILRRISVLFILTCLLGFTTNINDAFHHTYTPLVAFYVTERLFVALSFAWYGWQIPMVRGWMIGSSIMTVIPAAFWIASIHVEEPSKQGLIWPAIVLDLFGGNALLFLARPGAWMSKRFANWARGAFEFTPGANIEHRIERTAAFVTLVFGSSVLGLLYQSGTAFGINAFFGKAVLGLIVAFIFNWLYFEIDSFNLHTHAIRRSVWSALIWFSIHLPFIMSFVLSASALGFLVRAHDSPDSPVKSLYKTFQPRSEEHITNGLRWYYCAGLGISLACMGVITLSHVHKKIPNQRVKKHFRVLVRFAISLVIILLPLAHMNSLSLVATTTGLVVLVLLVELIGSTCIHENVLWNPKCKRGKCEYLAKCKVSKKELQESVEKGNVLNVEEIARRDGEGEKNAVNAV